MKPCRVKMPTQNLLRLLLIMMGIVLARVCCRFGSWGLVRKLDFHPDFEHKVWSRFLSWNSGEILKLKFGQYFFAFGNVYLNQPKPLITPEHTHLPKAYKLVWQKKKITLWLLFQWASRNVRLTGRERTCGPNHSTAFLPRFGLTVDFVFRFMFALKVWIIKPTLHPYLLLGIQRDHHL